MNRRRASLCALLLALLVPMVDQPNPTEHRGVTMTVGGVSPDAPRTTP